MPCSPNQENKKLSPCRWLTQLSSRLNGGCASFLLGLILLTTVGQAQQTGLQSQLESLSAAYREEENSTNHAKLLAFCQRNAKTPQAALGFFVLGEQAFEDHKFEEAKAYLTQSRRTESPIQDYVTYYAASVAMELKEFKECQSQLADFSLRFPHSLLVTKARLLSWQSSVELNDGEAILASIKGMPSLESNPDALFYQARAYELLGDGTKALPIYRRLHYQFPVYANAAAVSHSLSNLGGTDLEVPKEWRVTRIEKLFGARRHRDVLTDLQLLFSLDPVAAAKPQYQLWQGLSEFGTAQYYAAIQTLKALRSASPETAAQALFNIGECYRKLDNYAQFKQNAAELEAAFATSRWWEEALFSLGNYNLVRRDLDESLAFYQKIVDRFPTGARVKDSHWRISWYAYRGGNFERALDLFLEHLSRFPDSEYRAAALYWIGRTQLRLGKPLEARQVFEAVAQRFQTQYYGELARAQLAAGSNAARVAYRLDPRLEKVLANLKSTTGSPAVDLTPIRKASLNDWPRVKVLSQLSLFELAAQELQHR